MVLFNFYSITYSVHIYLLYFKCVTSNMNISKAKHITIRSMSRRAKHKRHQYNNGKPTKGKNPPRESFLNNDRTSTSDGDEPREDSLYIFLLDE